MIPGRSDLHRHLDGSLRPSTVAELARGRPVPPDLRFHAGMGLGAALERFAFTLSLLQSAAAVRRVAAEICEDAAIEGVSTLEIRFAPQLHGGATEAIVDAALEGIDRRAGLVLCGLYGEPPSVLEGLVALAVSRRGVVGIDLAGGPAPGHTVGMADYARPYRRAAELGLGRTVHAGEGRPPAEIRVAIEVLGAQRIGHGTTLLDDPAVLELVIERGVTVEACITSNWHVGAIPAIDAHPLPQWLDAGVRACICTDNTLLSETTAGVERTRAGALPGMDTLRMVAADTFGHAAAFPAMKRALDVWGHRVARLPARGVLLYATDMQGNRRDYEAMKQVYAREEAAGNEPVLAFCGDLVHGPSPDLNEPDSWPDYLGTSYVDESADLIRDFEQFTRTARAFTLLGNHEHAHIGGPVVPKFWPDEAAVLDAALGDDKQRIHAFMRSFPLLAVAPCGVVLTHGAPARTEERLEDFERFTYEGYDGEMMHAMADTDTLGALLWARSATPVAARRLLQVATLDGEPSAFVAFGHDIVHAGWNITGDEQICLSTSFGCFDVDKVYLRLELAHRYRSARELRAGSEIRHLHG